MCMIIVYGPQLKLKTNSQKYCFLKNTSDYSNIIGVSLQLLLQLFLFSLFFPITIHSVVNTSVKVSGSAHHYIPRKTSLKLCYVMCWLS